MKSIYVGSVGQTISLVLKDNGSPIDITTPTVVTLNLYYVGTNVLKWSHAATVDSGPAGTAHYVTVAGDFDVVGDFYSTAVITKTGFIQTVVDQIYEVIQNQQSIVTVPQLLEFMDIPTSNAKKSDTIQSYINMANTSLDGNVPSLANTVDQKFIQQKQRLIMIKAATLYYMNSGENNINPDVRIQKIKLWTDEYNLVTEKLNDSLSTTSTTGNGAIRRVKNTATSTPGYPWSP